MAAVTVQEVPVIPAERDLWLCVAILAGLPILAYLVTAVWTVAGNTFHGRTEAEWRASMRSYLHRKGPNQ